MTSAKLFFAPLVLVALSACAGAAAEAPAPTTSTTQWYKPTECGMGPAYLERLQAEAASKGYDTLETELERQTEVLKRCP